MIQKKVCLIGGYSVGKTSLITRFVSSIFSDQYLTTVGVKIDKKSLRVDDQDLKLMLWDLAGEDDFTEIRTSYLRGASACLLVIDGTRAHTAEVAARHHQQIRERQPEVRFAVAINKSDLQQDWEVGIEQLQQQFGADVPLVSTSAKTGASVDLLFQTIATLTLSAARKAA